MTMKRSLTLLFLALLLPSEMVGQLKCLQFGDSYSAGVGAPAPDDYPAKGICGHSPFNWGETYASITGCEYENRACVGAIIHHINNTRLGESRCVFGWQSCPANRTEDEEWVRSGNWLIAQCQQTIKPQIESVDEDTDYVLMTVGGNDMGFSALVALCFVPPTRFALFCQNQLALSEATLPQIEENLKSAVENIQD